MRNTRIELFYQKHHQTLEDFKNQVNEFMAGVDVIDVKYAETTCGTHKHMMILSSLLVLYTDDEKKENRHLSEAALQITDQHFTPEEMQAIKKSFVDYFEDKFNSILKKRIAKTDKRKVEKLLEFVRAKNPGLTTEQETELITALVVSGLVEGE